MRHMGGRLAWPAAARVALDTVYLDAGAPSNTPISLYLIEAIDDYQGGAMAQPCPMARECTRPWRKPAAPHDKKRYTDKGITGMTFVTNLV